MNINYADRESADQPLPFPIHRREQIRPFLPCISLLFEAEALSRARRALKLGKSAPVSRPGQHAGIPEFSLSLSLYLSFFLYIHSMGSAALLALYSPPPSPSTTSITRNYSRARIRKTTIVHCPALCHGIPYITRTSFLIRLFRA